MFTDSSAIAIVLPVYNTAPYLRECLDSILDQTLSNFTIFAVDDGSTDESEKILHEYANIDDRISILHQKNGGISNARNNALKLIEEDKRYKYIAFVDSDDRLEKDFLQALYIASENNDSDITVCCYSKFNQSGKIKDKYKNIPDGKIDRENFIELIFSINKWNDVRGSGGMVWKQLFRSSAIKDLRFSENRELVEDELYCLEAASRSQSFYYIQNDLYGYRQRNDSLANNKKFTLRIFNGRVSCWHVAKNISHRAVLTVSSRLAISVVDILKAHGYLRDINLGEYKKDVIEAAKNKLISRKCYILFIIFCDFPVIAKMYHLIRTGVRKICHRQKR